MEEDNLDRPKEPTAERVKYPSCGEISFAIIPQVTTIVDGDEDGDGKVWAICRDCQGRFLVHYQNES